MKSGPQKTTTDARAWQDTLERLRRLGAAGVPELVLLLGRPNWAERRQVVAELATLGECAVAPLCAVLTGDRVDEAKNAATMDALSASTGDPAPLLLRLAAEHEKPAILADAVQILGRRRERQAIPILAKLATAADDNVAVAAIEALGRIGGRGAVESLITLVRGGSFFRTYPAIDVLGRSADPRAVAPLAALLHDSRYALEAMRALSRTGDRAAVPPLAKMLTHASLAHVRVAAAALADLRETYEERYGDGYVIAAQLEQSAPEGALRSLAKALVGADSGEGAAIASVLGMMRKAEAVPTLSSLLNSPALVAKAAVAALEALGPKVTNQLLAILRAGDSTRRAMVLPLISSGMNGDDDILRCLSDPDGNVRALAAQALARIGSTKSISALFGLLEDPNVRVVQAAVGAIQALGRQETEALTLAAARSPEPRVRREALRIVRYFGYESALPIALSLLDSDDERLREAATMALSSIERPEARAAIIRQAGAQDPKTRAMAMRALGQGPRTDAAVRTLLVGTEDPDAWVRYYVAQALGRLGAVEALSAVIALLNDPTAQVRISAVEALSHLPCAEALTALKAAAEAAEPDVRRAAVLGFGTLKSGDGVPILLAALDSDDPATRLVATSALGNFEDPAAISGLGRAAKDPDESVRSTALGLLAGMRSLEATLSLIHLLPEYPHLDRVRLALSAASPGRIEGIARKMTDADDETAAILTSALARMRTREAIAALIDAFELPNSAARKAAATALGALGTHEALDALQKAASSDPDAEVRRISALAAAEG